MRIGKRNKGKSDTEMEYYDSAYILTERMEKNIILNYFSFDLEVGEITRQLQATLPEELSKVNETLNVRLRILDGDRRNSEENDSVPGKHVLDWLQERLEGYDIMAFSVRIDIQQDPDDECYQTWMFLEG